VCLTPRPLSPDLADQERGEQDPNNTFPPLPTGALSRRERGEGEAAPGK
jgi:hypothetical protein